MNSAETVSRASRINEASRNLERADAANAALYRTARDIVTEVLGFVNTGRYNRVTPDSAEAVLRARRPANNQVLLVEDDTNYAMKVAEIIRRHLGFDVVIATSVVDAVNKIEKTPFRALLVDVDLGDGLGMEVVEHARARDPEVAVIMTSGVVREQLQDIARRCTAGWFDKTQDPLVLIETLRRMACEG